MSKELRSAEQYGQNNTNQPLRRLLSVLRKPEVAAVVPVVSAALIFGSYLTKELLQARYESLRSSIASAADHFARSDFEDDMKRRLRNVDRTLLFLQQVEQYRPGFEANNEQDGFGVVTFAIKRYEWLSVMNTDFVDLVAECEGVEKFARAVQAPKRMLADIEMVKTRALEICSQHHNRTNDVWKQLEPLVTTPAGGKVGVSRDRVPRGRENDVAKVFDDARVALEPAWEEALPLSNRVSSVSRSIVMFAEDRAWWYSLLSRVARWVTIVLFVFGTVASIWAKWSEAKSVGFRPSKKSEEEVASDP